MTTTQTEREANPNTHEQIGNKKSKTPVAPPLKSRGDEGTSNRFAFRVPNTVSERQVRMLPGDEKYRGMSYLRGGSVSTSRCWLNYFFQLSIIHLNNPFRLNSREELAQIKRQSIHLFLPFHGYFFVTISQSTLTIDFRYLDLIFR
jgi:hypothetical protein